MTQLKCAIELGFQIFTAAGENKAAEELEYRLKIC